jgi:hypothetical protein
LESAATARLDFHPMFSRPLCSLERASLRRCLCAVAWRRAPVRWGVIVAMIVCLLIAPTRGDAAQQTQLFFGPSQQAQQAQRSRQSPVEVDRFGEVAPSVFAPPQHDPAILPTPPLLDASHDIAGTPPISVDIAAPGDCEAGLANSAADHFSDDCWEWQLLPDGLIYRSYLAGFKEPRLHSLWAYEQELGWVWDIALGGRVGILRYGDHNDAMPDGWQIDLEGAGFPRLDLEEERDLVAVDFRAGVPITYGNGPHRTKFAYYHLSSHLGDEFLLKNPTVTRYNYSRDVLVLGQSYYLTPDWRIYGEAGWAFYSDVSGEWEFQFGVDYSPIADWGFRCSPFVAFNAHLREEVDFGGNLVAQVGWQWRQAESGHLFRLGLEYFNGKSDQFEFFDRFENKIGLALWYDY